MSVIRHTKDGRRAAEALMTSTVQIGTVKDATDPNTGDPIQVITPVWTGKGRIHTRTVTAQTTSGPGVVFAQQDLILTIPVSGTDVVSTNMAVKVTADPLDDALVGTVYRIKGTSAESLQVVRRFQIERNS